MARPASHRVHRIDELVDPPLATQILIDEGVEGNGDAVAGRDRPAMLLSTLDEHLIGAEHVSYDLDPAVLSEDVAAGLEGLSDRRDGTAESPADHREVGPHPEPGPSRSARPGPAGPSSSAICSR
jgi:hypothetical protein